MYLKHELKGVLMFKSYCPIGLVSYGLGAGQNGAWPDIIFSRFFVNKYLNFKQNFCFWTKLTIMQHWFDDRAKKIITFTNIDQGAWRKCVARPQA